MTISLLPYHHQGNDGSDVPDCGDSPSIWLVPIERLRSSLKGLRSGCKPEPERPVQLNELPLRVVETEDGFYEIVDGFKRLDRWRASGLPRVPVVLETALSDLEKKVALLEANRPPRTLTPMDEAKVVHAIRHEDGLGPTGIAHVCGRKPSWVTTRLMLADRLSEEVARRVDIGTVGVTLAHALCALDHEVQESVCEVIERHGLKGQEALALVSAYRTCEYPDERRALLSNPLDAVRPSNRTAATVSALCTRLEEKLGRVQAALETIGNFILPDQGLTLPERRRLEAEHLKVIHQLFNTAQTLAIEHLGLDTQEVTNEGTRVSAPQSPDAAESAAGTKTNKEKDSQSGDRGATRGYCPPAQDKIRREKNIENNGFGTQGGAPRAVREGAHRESDAVASLQNDGKQARPLQGADKREGKAKPDHYPHPAGDKKGGLHRRTDHPCRLHPKEHRLPDSQEAGLAPLRDTPG